MLQASTEDIAW